MGVDLPDELLYQILISLPAKSLLRFRCVCKRWYYLIPRNRFIKSHYQHSQLTGNSTLLFHQYFSELYALHDNDERFHAVETFYFPFKSRWGYFTIVGCVNGLICLWDRGDESELGGVIFWNPAIRKCIILPKPKFYINFDKFRYGYIITRYLCFGFGYDETGNDYKAVCIVFYQVMETEDVVTSMSSVVVYSLNRKSWRKVECNPPLKIYSRPCTVGGVIYRITQVDNHGLMIVSFDLSSEVYSEFMCPPEVKTDVPYCKTELAIFCESLALVHEWNQKHYHIWVLRDTGGVKSWTKQFAIDLDSGSLGQRIIGFSENGLTVVFGEGNVVATPVVEDPRIVKFVHPEPQSRWHVECYSESLVLLKEGHDVDLASLSYNEEEMDGRTLI